MPTTASEIIWLRRLLGDMDIQFFTPTPLYCDNQCAIKIVNSVFHKRTKHIEMDYHFVRQYYLAQTLALPYVPFILQFANLFAKSQGV